MSYCILRKGQNGKWSYLKKESNNKYKFVNDRKKAVTYQTLMKAKGVAQHISTSLFLAITEIHIYKVTLDSSGYILESDITQDNKIKGWWTLKKEDIQKVDSKDLSEASKVPDYPNAQEILGDSDVEEVCDNDLSLLQTCSEDPLEDTLDSVIKGDDLKSIDNKDLLVGFLKCYLEELSKKDIISNCLSEKDKGIVDLLHAIEFKKANVVEGYKLFKELQTVLAMRRVYKDRLARLKMMESCLDKESAERLLGEIESLDKRVYNPRVLFDLFNEQ